MKMDISQIEQLIALVKDNNLQELSIADDTSSITIKQGMAQAAPLIATTSAAADNQATSDNESAVDDDLEIITSPFVGTFYSAPAPGATPFVDVGHRIVVGQVLCIVEAMKLMNEIEAERAGTIVEVLVKDGQAVEFGQALFKLRP